MQFLPHADILIALNAGHCSRAGLADRGNMAEFKTKLVVEELDDKTWKLKEDLYYTSDILGVIYVPAGFVTDFASVPRLPFAYLLAGDTAHQAAVVHDYLYQTHACSKS